MTTPNKVAEWKFDGSGAADPALLADTGPSGYNLTKASTAGYGTPGPDGSTSHVVFDGYESSTGLWVAVPTTVLDLTKGSYSFECRHRLDYLYPRNLIQICETSTNHIWSLFSWGGGGYQKLVYAANGVSETVLTGNLDYGAWHHYVFTVEDLGDGTQQIWVYVDGVKQDPGAIAVKCTSVTKSAAQIRFGYQNPSSYAAMYGALDNVRVWDACLTQEQVVSLFAYDELPAAPLPEITSFTADDESVVSGESTNLTAVFLNGTGEINNGIGPVTSGVPISTGILAEGTTFTLTVTNEDGVEVTDEVSIAVTAPPPINVGAESRLPTSSGARNATVEGILRSLLNPSIKGRGVTAVLAGLATGVTYLRDLAQSVFEQKFTSSASGAYLDQRCNDLGISRPAGLGMSDETLRELSILLTSEKLTYYAAERVLEIFYGSENTRATATSLAWAPFNLSGGETLTLLIDNKTYVNVVFEADDFVFPGQATATEIVVALNRTFKRVGATCFAKTFLDQGNNNTYVKILSGNPGIKGSVAVYGGSAQIALQFPEDIGLVLDPATTWSFTGYTAGGSVPVGQVLMSMESGTNDLSVLYEGDYVIVPDDDWGTANQGTWIIASVDVDNDGIYLINPNGLTAVTASGDVYFYRPTRQTIARNGQSALAVSNGEGVDVVLPATSEVVNRTLNTASYLNDGPNFDIDHISVNSGTVTVTTETAHGLSAGEWITLFDVNPTVAFADTSSIIDVFGDSNSQQRCILIKLRNGKVMAISGTASEHVYLYDPDTDTASELAPTLFNHSMGTAVELNDGRIMVVGGVSGKCEIYDFATNTWQGIADRARYLGKLVQVSDDLVSLVGGTTDEYVYQYSLSLNTWTQLGAWPAVWAGTVEVVLTDNRVMAFEMDGAGAEPPYIYNPATDLWTAVPSPNDFHGSELNILFVPIGPSGKVAICDAAASHSIEFFDVNTHTWSTPIPLETGLGYVSMGLGADNSVFLVNDSWNETIVKWDKTQNKIIDITDLSVLAPTDSNPFPIGFYLKNKKMIFAHGDYVQLFSPIQATTSYCGRINGTYQIAATPAPTTLTFANDDLVDCTVNGGYLILNTPDYSDQHLGPYLFSPTDGVAITSTNTTLSTEIPANEFTRIIALDDASDFSVDGGYLVFNFGKENQIGPIEYVARISATQLLMHPTFKPSSDILVNSTVTLLKQRGPIDPNEVIYGFYLTSSFAGRTACSDIIDQILGSGINVQKTVIYPGDRGLGNEGGGTFKTSDKEYVWGGND